MIKCTDLEGQRDATVKGKEWKNVDKNELMAFIGLTLLAGSEKNWDVSVRELFGSHLHNPMYKATMSVRRFEDVCHVLRFDDKRTWRQPGEEVQKNLGENNVKMLCSRFRNTGRNITTGNFFTSVPLAQHLLEKDHTIVGTL